MNRTKTIGISCIFLLLLMFGFGKETYVWPKNTPNVAKGMTYTLLPKPNYLLTQDKRDGEQLTDGHFTKSYFWKSKHTVGWKELRTIQIEIDLQTKVKPNKLCLNSARGEHAKVSYPQRIDVFSSVDRKNFKYQGNLLQGTDHRDGTYQVKIFCTTKFSTATRFVWIFIQPRGHYTFIDEIEIFGKRVFQQEQANYPLPRNHVVAFQQRVASLGSQANALFFAAQRVLKTIDKNQTAPDTLKTRNNLQQLLSHLAQETFTENESLNEIRDSLQLVQLESLHHRFNNSLVAWRNSPWDVFTSFDTPPPGPQKDLQPIHLEVMSQGTTSEAVNLTNTSRKVKQVRVTAQIHSTHGVTPKITLREAVPIITVNNEIRADPLVPFSAEGLTLKAGESKQVWLSIGTQDSIPQSYNASLDFKSNDPEDPPITIPLKITVRKATMPQHQNVYVTNWAYLNWRPIQKLPKQAIQDLVAHHTNVFVLHPQQLPWPKKEGEHIAIDYTKFDETIRHHPKTATFLFCTFFNNPTYLSLQGQHKFLSAEWKEVLTFWIRDWVKHTQSLGIGYDQFALYPFDEPRLSNDLRVLRETAKIIKAIDPHIKIYMTLPDIALTDLLKISPYVDVYQLKDNNLSGVLAKTLKIMKKQVWSYSAGGGGKAADPLGFYRLQAWKAVQAEVTGIGFWAYADTGSTGTAWDDKDGTRADYSVIYEGSNSIISSKRWEAWREGVEDYELLRLARTKLQGILETNKYWELVNTVIQRPVDYQNLQSVRSWMLAVASR